MPRARLSSAFQSNAKTIIYVNVCRFEKPTHCTCKQVIPRRYQKTGVKKAQLHGIELEKVISKVIRTDGKERKAQRDSRSTPTKLGRAPEVSGILSWSRRRSIVSTSGDIPFRTIPQITRAIAALIGDVRGGSTP